MKQINRIILVALLLIIGLVIIISIPFYFLLDFAHEIQNEYDNQCKALKIDCDSGMNIECANDCRLLKFKEFKYDKEGFGAWACYCLKPNGDIMKIW